MKRKKPGRLLLFWDYDTQWGGDRSRGPGGAKDYGHLDFEGTERLIDIHARYQIPACFAIVGAAATPGSRPYHDPGQIRRVFGAGHEIASHSLRHDWLPAMSLPALRENLRCSKDALEQCVGAPVTAFVPPHNQPFDYLRGWSVSVSERRAIPADRTDLSRLCRALSEVGYKLCRVAYRSLALRLADLVVGQRVDWPTWPFKIEGIWAVRLNSPGGFGNLSHAMLDRCAGQGGLAVVYGHPHSLFAANDQNEKFFIPFLEHVRRLRDEGVLQVVLPRDLTNTLEN